MFHKIIKTYIISLLVCATIFAPLTLFFFIGHYIGGSLGILVFVALGFFSAPIMVFIAEKFIRPMMP